MAVQYIINWINGQGLVNLYSSKQEKPRRISNHKEDVMRARGRKLVGFLAVMATIGFGSTSDSFAGAYRVDVIGNLGRTVAQSDSMKARGESMRVDVIARIVTEGPTYSYSQPLNR
jgi:hypothetical protein